jgi:transposase-like protein
VTSGTIFDSTRTPLTVWFQAAWEMTTNKSGASAAHLHRMLPIGSYPTIWAIMGRLRSLMGQQGAPLGEDGCVVEVDETFIGGARPGKRGRGAQDKQLVIGAVELPKGRRGFGRVRLAVIPDATKESLQAFITANISPNATIRTDGLVSYEPATKGYNHEAIWISRTGLKAHEVLPAVHRLFSLLKRWLDGTYQGGTQPDHLPSYLDEFAFRFNRRTSRKRGLLFLRLLQRAVAATPVTYKDLVVNPAPKPIKPHFTPGAKTPPDTLDAANAGRPWLTAPPLTPPELRHSSE